MKLLFAFAAALISHQAFFAAAKCQCNSNDVNCIQACATNMSNCVQQCESNDTSACTSECLSNHWPVTEKDGPALAPNDLVKRAEAPAEGDAGVSLAGAEASLSSHHGDGRDGRDGREGEGRGGHSGFGGESHGSHDSKKDGPEPGFMGMENHPPMGPDSPREEMRHDNDMHGDFKGREGFQHHNMAAPTNVFTVGTTATMALTVMGAFLFAA